MNSEVVHTINNEVNIPPEQKAAELKQLVGQLVSMGRTDLVLQSVGVPLLEELCLLAAKGRLCPLVITKDYRFFLDGNVRKEIDIQPVHKAVYLLFLAHPEGIEFKHLSEDRDELLSYYMATARTMDKERIIDSVEHLMNPLDNAINEKCSRIKKAFLEHLDVYSASYYIISGHTQRRFTNSSRIWYERLKVIALPRELVVFE